MKKFSLHLDALIFIGLLFTASFVFNIVQRYQYSDLLQENASMQMQSLNTEFGLSMNQALLEKCETETGWEHAPAR